MSEVGTMLLSDAMDFVRKVAQLSREDQVGLNIRLAGERSEFFTKEFTDNSEIPDMTRFLARITYLYYLHNVAFDSLEPHSKERDLALALWGFVDGTTIASEFLEFHDQIWDVIEHIGNPVARKELEKLFKFYDLDWAALSAQDTTTAQI